VGLSQTTSPDLEGGELFECGLIKIPEYWGEWNLGDLGSQSGIGEMKCRVGVRVGGAGCGLGGSGSGVLPIKWDQAEILQPQP